MTKGLNSSSAISLGRPHWCIFSYGPTNDNRTAGIVDTLTQQVLTEAALLALEHIGKRLQRAVARARYRTAATAVVEQAVHSLLQHALLVAHDDRRERPGQAGACSRLLRLMTRRYRSFRSDVAKRPPSSWTIGAQVGRDDRDHVQDHLSGLLPDFRKASTTSRRLTAFARFCFWPLAMTSRSSSALASRSMAPAGRARTRRPCRP